MVLSCKILTSVPANTFHANRGKILTNTSTALVSNTSICWYPNTSIVLVSSTSTALVSNHKHCTGLQTQSLHWFPSNRIALISKNKHCTGLQKQALHWSLSTSTNIAISFKNQDWYCKKLRTLTLVL